MHPLDFVYDVRMKRKGQPWQLWQDGVTVAADTFSPDSIGRVRFAARLRQLSSGASSDWSDPVAIRIQR